jgi:hypothetical protein
LITRRHDTADHKAVVATWAVTVPHAGLGANEAALGNAGGVGVGVALQVDMIHRSARASSVRTPTRRLKTR